MSEMSQPTCDVCGKEFAKKVGLQKHKERKNPCKAPLNLIQANNITQNISCWTSELDPADSNKAFSYNSNGSLNGVPTKLLSHDKIKDYGSFAQKILGVKEVSY